MGWHRQLHRDPTVIFAGYKVPHPLEHHIVIKVQTNEETTPLAAMSGSIKALRQELSLIKQAFEASSSAFMP
jgi:DNA-directed RNA polymerase II subunit RPB11